MRGRLSILRKHPHADVARSHPRRSRASRLAVGLAVSAAVSSTAFLLTYRWKKRERDAARLEHSAGPSLLDKVMPLYQFRDSIDVRVDAPPRQIFRAFDQLTLADMPLAWLLGTLRYLPAILSGKMKPSQPDAEPFAKQLMEGGSAPLAQETDREIVIGTIGKFHQLGDQAMVPFKGVEEFTAFADPDYQKLAISIRIEPGALFGESRLILEHRTLALSEESREQFARYWLAIKPGGRFISKLLLKAVKRRTERYVTAEITPRTPAPSEGMVAAAA